MNETFLTYKQISTCYRTVGLIVCMVLCWGVYPLQAQIVRVPTKGEIRNKQKEYSGKKGNTVKRSEQPAASDNAMGQRMRRLSDKRNSKPQVMLTRVQQQGAYLDINNPRNINLNTHPVEKLRHSKNPMGMAMYKNSLKANSKAKSMLVLSPAYRKKMMKRRDAQFASFEGERKTITPEYRKKMYKKRAKDFASYKGDIVVHKRPKGSYPDLKYRGNRKNSTFEKKEKYRKRVLKRMGKKKYIPAHMRRKDEKPTYDTRESEIWEKPR